MCAHLQAGQRVDFEGASYHVVATHVHKTRGRIVARTLLLTPSDATALGGDTTNQEVSSSQATQVFEKKYETSGVIGSIGCPMGAMTPPGQPAPAAALGSHAAPLLLGFDTEWQVVDGERLVLSVQISLRAAGGDEYVWVLWYPDTPVRFRLATVLAWFLADTATITGFAFLPAPKRARGAKRTGKETEKRKNGARDADRPLFHITLAGHYGIVDLTTMFDADKLLRQVDSIRRTLATVERPLFTQVWSDDRNRSRDLAVHVRDTMLLAPAKSKLKELGEALNFPKFAMPEEDMSNMARVRRESPWAFLCYAARDAEIARRWIEEMVGRNAVVPVTLSGQAASMLRDGIMAARAWTREQFDLEWRGLASVAENEYDRKANRLKPHKVLVPRPEASLILTAATHAFYGGRNEGMLFGIHHAAGSGWSDFDLSGAYPTAMCLVPDPDYSAAPRTLSGRLERGSIQPNDCLFGHVRFAFPPETAYPCLPVKDGQGRGLVFPLNGASWASAPELWLALELGCEIEFTQPAFLLPTTGQFSLGEGVKGLVLARKEATERYGKNSVQAVAAKERANSSYGKTAQGLQSKRAFSTRHAATRDTPPSLVTSAPQAALTTGLVRAVVSAAMHQLHERGYRIASVTTDGFLTDAPRDVLEGLDLFGLKRAFARARDMLVGSDTVWELKHRARSLVMLKTRGGFGVGTLDDAALPHAGAGYKVSGAARARVKALGKAEALAELFLRREGAIGFCFHALPSPGEYVKRQADGIGHDVDKEVSWEWDYKREPDPGTLVTNTVEIDGVIYEHVSYSTRPWSSIDEFINARAVAAEHPEAVKTVKQARAMAALIERRPAAIAAGVRHRGGLDRAGAISILRGIRSGLLAGDWFRHEWSESEGERPRPRVVDPESGEAILGRAVCERVGAVFDLKLDADDWKNAGRQARSTRVLYTALHHELAALGLSLRDSAGTIA